MIKAQPDLKLIEKIFWRIIGSCTLSPLTLVNAEQKQKIQNNNIQILEMF